MVAAILLLIGANMVIDPDGFPSLPQNLVVGIRNFEHHIRGAWWREMSRDPWRRLYRGQQLPEISPARRTRLRITGAILITLGLLAAVAS
jgi:hypothetical protein